MINLNNYETWFLLYADNELSAEEQSHVLQFVQEHPEFQDEFDGLQEMKLLPNEDIVYRGKEWLKDEQLIETETGIYFEPDMAITYPNKQELYRKESSKLVMWLRPLQVAAVLLLGMFWFINRSTDEVKPLAAGTSGDSIKKSVAIHNRSNIVSDAVVVNHRIGKTPTHHDVSMPVEYSSSTNDAVSTDNNNKEQVSIQEIVATKPASNFTEEAVKAASERISTETPALAMNAEQTTAQLYEEPARSKKSPLRGLLRKITRTVLNENEENDGRNYVHVASFTIPVSKTNNK